jgi:uncharacterized protein (TIGR02145 family)
MKTVKRLPAALVVCLFASCSPTEPEFDVEPPTLISPGNNSSSTNRTPFFNWSDEAGAKVYELVVDNSSGFESPEIHETSLTSSNYSSPTSLPIGAYCWKVRCKDFEDNWWRWSAISSFAIVEPETVTDIDGNVYPTVKIGNQWWMAENLKVTHYRNGAEIPNITGVVDWMNQTTGAYCNYDNNEQNVPVYGRLYNWYAAHDSRQIAPAGWHVPSDAEWQKLIHCLGGGDVAGGKMKVTGTGLWDSPNTGATNESGFSAIPGGWRLLCFFWSYYSLGETAAYWSSTIVDSEHAWALYLHYDYSTATRYSDKSKSHGFSVRCIRD